MAQTYVTSSGVVLTESDTRNYVTSGGDVQQEAAASNTTPVSRDLSVSYEVRAKVSRDLSPTFTVESSSTAVSRDLSASYAVLAMVYADLAGISVIVQGGGTASFTTDKWGNNTTTPREGASVSYTWYPGGRIGSLGGITPIEGTGVLNAENRLVMSNLVAGAGCMFGVVLGATPAEDDIYYQVGTAV